MQTAVIQFLVLFKFNIKEIGLCFVHAEVPWSAEYHGIYLHTKVSVESSLFTQLVLNLVD